MKKKLYWVLIVAFSAIFIVSAVYVVDYFIKSQQSKDQWEDIQSMFTPGPTTSSIAPSSTLPITFPHGSSIGTNPSSSGVTEVTEPSTVVTEPTETTQPVKTLLDKISGVYNRNKDVVGWIQIDDTSINYPILQRKSEKDYYLYRNFYGNQDKHGCIYARETCDMVEPTDVITIYGHYMSDGTMFHDIHKYYGYGYSRTFFDTHPYIYLANLYEEHTYQVVCLFKTSGTYGEGFPFHLYDDFADEAEYEEFINGVRGLAIYDSGIETQYGDTFICLSTCEYSIENGRLVLVAKRIS